MGVVTVLLIPTLLWLWSMHHKIKCTYEMHLEPDEYGFGTKFTNELLEKHMEDEVKMHHENLAVTRDLKHAIRELSHYARWAAKQQTGKEPPPYTRDIGD